MVMKKTMELSRDSLNCYAITRKIDQQYSPKQISIVLGKELALSVQKWKKSIESTSAQIDIIDLFCGCGGVSAGFLAMNQFIPAFRLIGALDIDKDACETFSQLGLKPLRDDICKYSDSIVTGKKLLAHTKRDYSNPLIVIGCPPCQGFTSHRKKNWDKPDERNDLITHFAKVAVKLSPDYIFMENVPELLSKKYWDHFISFKTTVEKAGYNVLATIVNMAGFGLSQERHRAIVFASKAGLSLPEPFLSSDNYVTVREAIGDLPTILHGVADPNDPYHVTANHRKSTIDVIKAVPKNGGKRPRGVGPKCLDKVKGFSDVYGRLRWDEPSITITGYARNPASGRYVHPEQDRGLSIREVAILQGFPDYFEFKGSFDSKYLQIGNAVPPLFASYIAAHILGDLGSDDIIHSDSNIKEPVSSSFSSVIACKKIKQREKKTSTPYVAVDAFCGAGGLSLGLMNAGFEIAYAYDNNPKVKDTYENNIHDHIKLLDAAKLDIVKELKEAGYQTSDIDLFAGGPPCQGFSIQRRGDDEDSRNSLVNIFFEQALTVRPKFILMENVLGINGKRGKSLLDFIKTRCEKANYHVHIKPLNAADYGVPQIRKRVFIVAERLDGHSPAFTFPKAVLKPEQYKTVREAIGDLPSLPKDGTEHPDIPNHRADKLSKKNKERFEHVPQGGGREDIPRELRLDCHKVDANTAGHRYVFGRLSWDMPSGVITARFDSLTRGRFGHPEETRTISLREGARLQTFPDKFVFKGTKTQVAQQIGNAVPPLLAETIGKEIINAIISNNRGQKLNVVKKA